MDVIDAISGQDVLALNGNVDANLGSKGAWKDSNPNDRGRRGVASIADAEDVQAREFYVHTMQVADYFGADRALPDPPKRVTKAEGSKLLRNKVCLGASRLDPAVEARASDETGVGGKAIVVALGLDSRGRAWSGRLIRGIVGGEADVRTGVAVHSGGLGYTGGDECGRCRSSAVSEVCRASSVGRMWDGARRLFIRPLSYSVLNTCVFYCL